MDFQIHTDLNTLPSVIDYNHEELKAWLSESLEYYNTLVVTEDSIKDAKADKAKLNALKKAIDDERKKVKKSCLAPYEAFEKKVKELLALIDAPILAIDTQVKAFDEIKKTEKKAEIEEYFNFNVGHLKGLLTLPMLWDDRWLNVTFAMKDIQESISNSIKKVFTDLNVIKSMELECEQRVTDVYLQTLDLSKALEEKARYEEQQKKIAEYEAKTAAEKVDVQTEREIAEDIREMDDIQAAAPKPTGEQTKTIKVIFYDTTAAFRADMKALTDKHNIKYGGIK